MATNQITVGRQITIPAGTRVKTTQGLKARAKQSTVTVTAVQPASRGKTRVFWKSGGYQVSALIPV